MKKLLFHSVFVLLGVGMWGVFSTTTHFTVKKWDAKFESIVRDNLSRVGLRDQDILSSVNEVQKSSDGAWVVHSIALKKISAEKMAELKKGLADAGAQVETIQDKTSATLLVKRGNRVYQKIKYTL